MSYLESGFDKYLQRTTLPPPPQEYSEDLSSQTIPLLTGGAVAGGITTSTSNRIQIDWEKGQILVGDGANWRVIIGDDGL